MKKSSNPICSVASCDRETKARGYCSLHYRRWRTHGDPTVVLIPQACRDYVRRPEAERFWEKVDKTPTCWLWTGGRSSTGYGSFAVHDGAGRRTVNAHRWAYENVVGPVPDGLHLDHLCRVRHCVNPAHLEPVTNQVNSQRGADARFGDFCQNGHPKSADNTLIRGDGRRECRVCHREREAERKSRLRHASCGVDDCGNRRCSTCDERLMCTGPEPAVNACAAHDDECQSCNDDNPCRECAATRRAA